jgi:hypothetical protein
MLRCDDLKMPIWIIKRQYLVQGNSDIREEIYPIGDQTNQFYQINI